MILIVPDGLNPGTHIVINLDHVRALQVGTMRAEDTADPDTAPTRDGMPKGELEVDAPDYVEVQWDNGATETHWLPKGGSCELIAHLRDGAITWKGN